MLIGARFLDRMIMSAMEWRGLDAMGDPFRVGVGEDMMRDHGCMSLRFMYPRLLRDVPFGDGALAGGVSQAGSLRTRQ